MSKIDVPFGCIGCPDSIRYKTLGSCDSWLPHYAKRQLRKFLPCNAGGDDRAINNVTTQGKYLKKCEGINNYGK